MQTPTVRNQQKSLWLVGGIKIKINTLSTVTNNGKKSHIFLSVDGMLRKEALVMLKTLRQLMAEELKELLLTYMAGSKENSQFRLQGCTTV